MIRRFLLSLLLGLLAFATSSASAEELRAGDLIIDAEGGFAPKALPKHENAPITIHGGGSISTISGEPPPVLETIDLEFDRHGSLETTGLEVCKKGKLEARTVAQARNACPGAILGEGSGHAIVQFPESQPPPSLGGGFRQLLRGHGRPFELTGGGYLDVAQAGAA